MKICTIVGARPQFIKAAVVSRAILLHNRNATPHSPLSTLHSPLPLTLITEVNVHTGQHYDYEMSKVFFEELNIPEPNYHLEIGSGSHGDQTGRMLKAIENVLVGERPDAILVYGDTNSTLAGALAASKLHIPVAHVEAGLRSFNRRMPEEINRVLTDHIAAWHFCPTETAVENLKKEGITEGVHLVLDVMEESLYYNLPIAQEKSQILEELSLPFVRGGAGRGRSYALATIHRPENTDDPARLQDIFEALAEISKTMSVVLPLHPRTRKAFESTNIPPLCKGRLGGVDHKGIIVADPVSYLDMIQLEANAEVILTDSGGMQKEAMWLGVPCITMRDETEWVETVSAGCNVVAGVDREKIVNAFKKFSSPDFHFPRSNHQEQPGAGERIVAILQGDVHGS